MHIAVNWGVGTETPQHQKQHFPLQCDTDAADLASQSQTGDARVNQWKDKSSLIENKDLFSLGWNTTLEISLNFSNLQ